MRQRVHKPRRLSLSRVSADISDCLCCCGNFENTLLIEFMPRRQVDNFRRQQLATVGNALIQQQQKIVYSPSLTPTPLLPYCLPALSASSGLPIKHMATRCKYVCRRQVEDIFYVPSKARTKNKYPPYRLRLLLPLLLLLLQLRLRQAFALARALSACHDNLNACCVLGGLGHLTGAGAGAERQWRRRLAAATGK